MDEYEDYPMWGHSKKDKKSNKKSSKSYKSSRRVNQEALEEKDDILGGLGAMSHNKDDLDLSVEELENR